MHFHLPKPLHGWRQFAGEVGIIVIGVLIALAAEQMVHDIDARRRTAEAQSRIKEEVGDALELGIERIAVQKCLQSQIGSLAHGLSSGRDDWSELVLPQHTVFPLVLRELYRSPDRVWVDDAYREALTQGDLNSAPAEERSKLASLYREIDELRDLNRKEHELSTQLSVLQFNPSLSQVERHQLVAVVAQLDYINALMILISHQMIMKVHDLGPAFQSTPKEIEEAQRGLRLFFSDLRDKYGQCVDIHAAAEFDRRLG